jgi:NAD(P)-dependent dehydrogenase (short-subunit alcohol dehydrogenase family)
MTVDFDVKGKVIALTGAASGIGLETAKLLAAQGCKLSLADVNPTALDEKMKEIAACAPNAEDVFSCVVDVRKPEQVDSWIEKTVAKFGKLDGGVNMAGVIPKVINIERVEDLNDEDWQFVMDVK